MRAAWFGRFEGRQWRESNVGPTIWRKSYQHIFTELSNELDLWLFKTGQARGTVERQSLSGASSFVAPEDAGLPSAFQQQPYSERTSSSSTTKFRRIVEESHREADQLLAEHRDKLEALAQALLKSESINAKEIREVTGLTEPRNEG